MSSPEFNMAVERVLGHEGGYVNDPRDPGGETNWGITKTTAQQAGYKGSMKSMTRQQAIDIYEKLYWAPIAGDKLPFAIAFQTFDAAVNHGVGNASRWLQQTVGAAVDGDVGPKTIEAAHTFDLNDQVLRFNAIRIKFYTSLSTFATYGKGWMNRVAKNLDYGVGDTPP